MTSEPTNLGTEGSSSSNTDAVSISFDYTQLSTTVAMEVRESVARIREKEHNVVQQIFVIGRELRNVKAALPHGAFGPWLEAEFGWNERTVQRYMRADKVLGAESDTVSDLPAAAIYALSAQSTRPEIREKILARLKAREHLTTRDILEQVKQKRQKPTPSTASGASDSQGAGQQLNEPPADQFDQPVAPDADPQAGPTDPAKCATRMLFKDFKGDRNVLASCLSEADAEEFLRHMLQGCLVQDV